MSAIAILLWVMSVPLLFALYLSFGIAVTAASMERGIHIIDRAIDLVTVLTITVGFVLVIAVRETHAELKRPTGVAPKLDQCR